MGNRQQHAASGADSKEKWNHDGWQQMQDENQKGKKGTQQNSAKGGAGQDQRFAPNQSQGSKEHETNQNN